MAAPTNVVVPASEVAKNKASTAIANGETGTGGREGFPHGTNAHGGKILTYGTKYSLRSARADIVVNNIVPNRWSTNIGTLGA